MTIKRSILSILLLCLFFLLQGENKEDNLFFSKDLNPISEDNIYQCDGYYIWDTSIVKGDDGKYNLVYSRWDKKDGFGGWLVFSEVVYAVSDSPTGPWKYKKVLLKGRGNGYWDELSVHNPVLKFFNGKYYLYYNSTNLENRKINEEELIDIGKQGSYHPLWTVVRNNQRVGVAVASSIDGPWERADKPLIEPSGPIATITNNPAVTEKEGVFYLIVKGDKPNETRFVRNQAIALSNSPEGPFVMQEKAVIDYLDTEDASLWYDAKRDYFYAVFHTNTDGGFIGMVSSPDGVNWNKANEFKIMPKKILMSNGDYLLPQRLERPFVYVEDSEPKVLALAVKEGDNSYLVFIPFNKKHK
ncbi:MAG: glycoside hydrolase family protein [Dysgonomonas sp.]